MASSGGSSGENVMLFAQTRKDSYEGFLKWGYPTMDGLCHGKYHSNGLKWMIWGYPNFRKHHTFPKKKNVDRIYHGFNVKIEFVTRLILPRNPRTQ